MGRYVIRRLLLTIPVLLGASFLIFAMVYALPGDPIAALAGDRPLAPAVEAQLREDFNLNDPLPVQYVKYLGNLAQGDLGTDFSNRPVLDTISQRLPVTLKLTVVAVLFETIIGLIAGVLAGIRRNSFFDNLVLVSTTLVISIPILVLGFSPSTSSASSSAGSPSPASTTAGTAICCPAWCWPRRRWPTWPG